jgi:hypothetical protein
MLKSSLDSLYTLYSVVQYSVNNFDIQERSVHPLTVSLI